jgi:hypothetical protein
MQGKAMIKDRFDLLRDKTERIVAEGLRLAKTGKQKDYCTYNCASCLAAEARTNVDETDGMGGFDSSEDICMTEATNILADKLDWEIN